MRKHLSPGYLFLAAALASASLFALNLLSPKFVWINESAHAAVEAFVAMAVISMALMLLNRRKERGGDRFFWVAVGLLVMGILLGFHSVARLDHGMVLLNSLAGLSGGFFCALVWLPESVGPQPFRRWLPWTVAALSALLGVSIFLYREVFPLMHVGGRFTLAAVLVNLLAGAFFMAATSRFLLDYRRSGDKEDLYLPGMMFLFGLAALSFPLSAVWYSTWWFWHALRLTAAVLVLGALIREYQRKTANLSAIIATQEKTEDSLRQTGQYLDNLINFANAPIIVWDPSFKITRFNHAFERLAGYAAEETIGNDLKMLFPEANVKDAMEKIARTLGGEYWESVEIPIRRKDGTVRIALWNSANIQDGDTSKISATIAQGMDITERKQAEQELRETRDYLQNLLDYANAPIIVWDEAFRIIRFNHAFERLTGLEAEEVLGKDLSILFPEGGRREVLKKIDRTLNGEYWLSVEIPIQRKDGSVRTALWNSANIYAKDGKALLATIAQGQDITERKQAEEALLAAQEQLREAHRLAHIGVWEWEIAGDRVTWSRELYFIVGADPAKPAPSYNTGLSRFYTPDSWRKLSEAVARAMDEGKPYDLELAMVHLDGTTRWTHTFGGAKYDDQGKIVGLFGTVQDITERKQAEDALRESEDQYRTMIEQSNDLIWTLDNAGNSAFFNKKAEEVSGYKLHEWLGRSFAALIPPEDLPRISKIFSETMAGNSQRYEADFYKKDGSLCSLAVNTSPILRAGEVVGTVSFGIDITGSRRAETLINSIIESVDEGFAVIDREHRILSANRAYCGMVKMPAADVIGQHCYRVFHHRNRPCYEEGEVCAVMRTFETGAPHEALHTHYDSQGTSQYIQIKSFPMRDTAGKFTAAIEIVHDITAQKTLEDHLRQAQKLEGIGQLAGGIAHDFNNVLGAVMNFAGVLQMKMTESDPLRHYADEIVKASERAADLTRQILAFSRKQVFDLKPARLNGIVRGLEKMLRRLLPESIDIAQDLSGEDPLVLVDAGQIGQVLINLVTNARDAMAGSGRIGIATEKATMDRSYIELHGYGEPGDYAVLSVSDTGCGMDAATRAQIFEPFFTTKKVGKGTGLGLAVVHGIVKQHQGYVNVYSEVGKGTVIRVYLPLAAEADMAGSPSAAPARVAGGSETILVAEDDAILRKISRTVLGQYGYTVIEAADGGEAVAKFAADKGTIRLVILDGIMPKKGGVEALAEIRRLSPDVKALFMSGYANDIFSGGGLRDKGAAFIQKPVMPIDLLRKVREVLDA